MAKHNIQFINIADETNTIASFISNFSNTSFIFDGIQFNSAESFIQSLKFDNVEKQCEIGLLEAYKARMKGKKQTIKTIEKQCVYWKGQPISLFSDDYYYLIYSGLKEKFVQNKECLIALLLTDNIPLIFDNGYEEPKFSLLSNERLIQILIYIRDELKTS